jgi:hypothetical protein
MSFIVAGCVLLLALLVGIVILGEAGVRGRQKARRDVPHFHAWWW